MVTNQNEIKTAKFKAMLEMEITYRKPSNVSEEDFLKSSEEVMKQMLSRKGVKINHIRIEKYEKEQQL